MVRIVTKRTAVYSRQEIWFWQESDGSDFPHCGNNLYYQALEKPSIDTELIPFHSSEIDLNADTEETSKQIRKNFRYEIKRAGKEAFRFDLLDLSDSKHVAEYADTFNTWADSKNMSRIDTDRHQAMVESANFSIVKVSFEDQPVIWHSYLHDESRARLLTSHSNLEFTDKAKQGLGNKFMHWQAILHFKAQGHDIYDFGGVDEEHTPGIAWFKLSFGGNRVTHYNFAVAKGLYKLKSRLRS